MVQSAEIAATIDNVNITATEHLTFIQLNYNITAIQKRFKKIINKFSFISDRKYT